MNPYPRPIEIPSLWRYPDLIATIINCLLGEIKEVEKINNDILLTIIGIIDREIKEWA